ncbi:MAG: DUF4129 domain-containing protein [Pseudomonadota bacterium]
MQLEDLRIALRPRRPWEAVDLGLTLVQTWWPRLFGVWFAVSLPLFLLINLVLDDPFWSVLALWWLKPLFDRALLHVLSRAVFGATPGVRDTLRALPGLVWNSGLFWHLTLGRLDFARSFRLPVYQLEGLKGKARRARLQVLGARGGGYGAGLTTICLHLEAFLYVGLFALGYLMLPESIDIDPFEALAEDDGTYQLLWNGLAYLAMSVIEPFYVASGFGLYLNRRTVLEAWDLELDLRRMAGRLQALRSGAGINAVLAIACSALLLLTLQTTPAAAKLVDTPVGTYDRTADAQAEIREVFEDPAFGRERTYTRWVPKNDREEDEPDDDFDFKGLVDFANTLGKILEGLGWALAAAAIIGLIVYLLRHSGPVQEWLDTWRDRRREVVMPKSVSGLDLEPESLPPDIVAGARSLWAEGQHRRALSVLYRGAIVEMLTRGMALPESATEGDVLRRAEPRLGSDAFTGLRQLVGSWQRLAYAHRAPEPGEFESLCGIYSLHFVVTADDEVRHAQQAASP